MQGVHVSVYNMIHWLSAINISYWKLTRASWYKCI